MVVIIITFILPGSPIEIAFSFTKETWSGNHPYEVQDQQLICIYNVCMYHTMSFHSLSISLPATKHSYDTYSLKWDWSIIFRREGYK